MSHLVTVKEPNMSVPGRGIVPDETQLLVDQRQLDRFGKGPMLANGKLAYGGPGQIVKPIADLTSFAPATIAAAQQVTFSGTVVAFGLLHVAAPVTTGLNVVLGIAVGADGTTYVAPATSARNNFVAAGYNANANWARITPVKFKAGQFIHFSCVTETVGFVSGAGLLVAVLQDNQNAYSAFS